MKKQLQIEDNKARSLYKDASPEFKAMLEDSFSKEFFSQDITERVKSYEDACRETGATPIDVQKMHEEGYTIDEIMYIMLKEETKALNEGWIADYKNGDQKKWFPVFRWDSSLGRFVFSFAAYYYTYAHAGYGSRLAFKSEKLAIYAGQQFIDQYEKYIM